MSNSNPPKPPGRPIPRRSFLRTSLRAAGWGLGLGLAGTAGWLTWKQPRRQTLDGGPENAKLPTAVSGRKRVVVIGGGLAGVATAIELAARKFEVTLVERAGHLGGKLGGWNVKALGESWPTEHGFHGFFVQYYNLREHLDAAGAVGDLHEPPDYPIAFPHEPTEVFGKTTTVFPFNMLQVVRRSPSLHLKDFMHDGDALYGLMKWAGEATYSQLDGTDFRRYIESGINRPMRELVIEPFGKTTLNRVDALSAAEGVRFFHFYFLGNPEGLSFRYTTRDSMTAILGPLERRLRGLGGEVRLGVAARRLVTDGGKVVGVELEGTGASPATIKVPAARCPAKPHEWAQVEGPEGRPLWLGRGADGKPLALDARCTHMGCLVGTDAETGGFRCPCHGGTFDAAGVPTGGPPQRPLRALPVVQEGAELVVGGGVQAGAEVLPADYVVVACEVRGLKELMARSDYCGQPILKHTVGSLGEADPYIVYRLWLDKPVRPDRWVFYTCAKFKYLDAVAVYSQLQEPYIGWARRTGGSVVEVHAYAIAPDMLRSSDEMARALVDEMTLVLPELKGARILHGEYQQQSNFSRFAPGDHAARPGTDTPLPNLFLAGDHVRMAPPVALMEAAVMSGRFAANGVLRREGLRLVPIHTVALRGVLA